VTGQVNELGQPIGDPLIGWSPPPFPSSKGLTGRLVHLDPLDSVTHGPDLVAAFHGCPDSLWTYLPFGPFADERELTAAVDGMTGLPDRQPYAIVVDGAAVGFASYLRVDRPNGVLEIGSIGLSPALQRTTAATEALFLMIEHAFGLGYRRCEWKCDDLNAPSKAAALRLGFTYEGTFRQATHYKDRNRDTAWYAIVDHEWPDLRRSFEAWLSPDNFDEAGAQQASLAEVRARG
jgi:RimJ/RimL family protein N-acetyltransferase